MLIYKLRVDNYVPKKLLSLERSKLNGLLFEQNKILVEAILIAESVKTLFSLQFKVCPF